MANIFEAMAGIMVDIDAVGKNQKNQSQGFKFRGIDDVYNAVHPILAKHGVFTIPTVLNERTEERQTNRGGNLIYRILTIKYTFYASDGTSVDAVVIGEGMDSGDKGANKAMAVGHKYALLQALCIPTEDMVDPDLTTPEPSTRKSSNKPKTTQRVEAPPLAPPDYDPETASRKEVAGVVDRVFNPQTKPIAKGLFTIKRAWNSILELCGGDVEFSKGIFSQYGADTSEKITYDIYLNVFDALKEASKPQQENLLGPESFDDDIPFGYEPQGDIA